MTDELTKTFFDTFGIEPIKECKHFLMGDAYHNNDCDNPNNKCDVCEDLLTIQDRIACPYYERDMEHYPTITDSILLELICILSEWRTYLHSSYTIKANNTLNLKQDVLKDFLELFKWYEFKKCEKGIKHQVRTLFEEG